MRGLTALLGPFQPGGMLVHGSALPSLSLVSPPVVQSGTGGHARSPEGDDAAQLISPRSAAAAHSLERSLRRNKLARGQCGKSSRRWHMLQSLHLAVVKSFLKKQRRQRWQAKSAAAVAALASPAGESQRALTSVVAANKFDEV